MSLLPKVTVITQGPVTFLDSKGAVTSNKDSFLIDILLDHRTLPNRIELDLTPYSPGWAHFNLYRSRGDMATRIQVKAPSSDKGAWYFAASLAGRTLFLIGVLRKDYTEQIQLEVL